MTAPLDVPTTKTWTDSSGRFDPASRTVQLERSGRVHSVEEFGAILLERIRERAHGPDGTVERDRYGLALVRRGKEALAGEAATISLRLQEARSGPAVLDEADREALRARISAIEPELDEAWIRIASHADRERTRSAGDVLARRLGLPLVDRSA